MAKKKYEKSYKERNPEKIKEWNRLWIQNNRDRYNASKWILYDKNKRKILSKFSNGKMECAMCNIDDIFVLTLDHINNDGAEHRKNITNTRRGGIAAYKDYRLGNVDSDYEIQVLCMNCNLKKEMLQKHNMKMQNPIYEKYYNSL